MFVTPDNDGYIQINYTTDVELAEQINLLASEVGMPSVATPLSTGGYRMPILESIADGRHFQVLKSYIPEDKNHAIQLANVLKDPETVYHYVDGAKVTIVQMRGWSKAETLADHGWEILADQKTFKRLKTLDRRFRLWSQPDFRLRVAIVDDDDYTDSELVNSLSPELKERLLDGGFVICRSLYDACLENLEFPSPDAELHTGEDMRAVTFRNQATKFQVFNARLFGNFHYVGLDPDDPLHNTRGMLKGQAFIHADDMCERMHVHVIAARSALKKEVSSDSTWVLLDPQSAKYHANGDVQSIANNPVLYDPNFIEGWIKALLLGALEDLKEDKLMDQWYQMSSPSYYANNQRRYDEDDLITLTKWNARTWVMSGMSLRNSPWLFEQMAKNVLSLIHTNDVKRLRIPIPCAVRCQVISQSMSSMAGVDMEIERGSIRWSHTHEVLVVHDEDWIEMYESHGGNDLDDFFVGYWRTMNGLRKVIVMRSPNDLGEYTIFDFVEGDWFPTNTLHDGRTVMFPEVSGDPDRWPKRLSEAVRDGDILYQGLPSSLEEKIPVALRPYGLRDTIAAIENNTNAQSCVGANVNARTLHSSCVGKHRSVQLAPMEACIDTGAQGGHADDIAAVTTEAQAILRMIIDDPSIKVDAYLWRTRFETFNGIPFDVTRLDNGTTLFRINATRMAFIRDFIATVRDFVSKYVGVNTDPRVHSVGKRFVHQGLDLLKAARYSLAMAQSDGEQATNQTWVEIHNYVLGEINKFEKESDRYDMMMGLYSASLLVPTRSTGKVSDQLVMNPMLFPVLMDALRFYGIAGYLKVDEHGRILRDVKSHWDLECISCGYAASTEDPLVVQAYHIQDQMCVNCHTQNKTTP